MIKLSFIVPVYNVAPYLRKCVESLLAQDYDNYEIILVDDGSTDESGAICDEYAYANELVNDRFRELERPLIRVIHRENGGLSAARNSGIEVAQGEYIMFVDSDDFLEPNVLGGLMKQVEREELDVLRFDYQNVRVVDAKHLDAARLDSSNLAYEVFEPYKRSHRLENDYSDEVTDGVTFLNTRMSTACYAVIFILRRDLIYTSNIKHQTSNILFTEKIYFEDTDWTPRMLCKAKRVASTNTIVYNYLMREGSITKAIDRSKQKKVLDDKMRLIATLQKQAVDLQKSGGYNRWYRGMISDTVVSVIGMLSVSFYADKDKYLTQLSEMNLYPIEPKSFKARIINLSPKFAVELLHMKNKK